MGKKIQWWLSGILVVLGLAVIMRVMRMINPVDCNHIILINSNGETYEHPLTLQFQNADGLNWERLISAPQQLPLVEGGLIVLDTDRAFFGGQLTLVDRNGKTINSVEFSPPGRYYHTAIMSSSPEISSAVFDRLELKYLTQNHN